MKLFDSNKIKEMWKSFLKDPFFLHKWDNELIYSYGRRGRDNKLHEDIYHGYSRNPFYLRSDSHMLIQDVYTGILPYRHFTRGAATGPRFVATPAVTPVQQRMMATGIASRDHAFDLSEACSEFIRNTTQQLMSYGHVDYEIIYAKEADALQSFSFDAMPDKYLIKIFGNYYQIIPWWVAKKARTRAGIIKIPHDKVLQIKFPKELGGEKSLMKTLARIYKISNNPIPPFVLTSMEKNEQTGFDSNQYSKNKFLEIATLTKRFGWNQRASKNDYTTEYSFFKRYLDSELARVIQRESILKSLNEALNGPVLNLGVVIQMEGYTTREEIEAWRTKLEAGNLKFLDMFNDLKDR